MTEREQFLPADRIERLRPASTKGKRLADLEDLDIVSIAYGIFLQDGPVEAAVWEKRLYKKYRSIIEDGREVCLRIRRQTQEKIISICGSDPTVIRELNNQELPIFATIVNDLRVKRERSMRYFRDKERRRILAGLPPGTRPINERDIEKIRVDSTEKNLTLLAGARRHLASRWDLLRWGLVAIAATTGVLGNAKGGEPQVPEPLLKDQARVAPTPDFAKTAPPEIARIHEVVENTIADFPPEVGFRLVDKDGNYISNAEVTIFGKTTRTNGLGLIHIVGDIPISPQNPVKTEIEIKLEDGRVIKIEKEVRGGYNSDILNNRRGEFIQLPI